MKLIRFSHKITLILFIGFLLSDSSQANGPIKETTLKRMHEVASTLVPRSNWKEVVVSEGVIGGLSAIVALTETRSNNKKQLALDLLARTILATGSVLSCNNTSIQKLIGDNNLMQQVVSYYGPAIAYLILKSALYEPYVKKYIYN